MPEVLKKPLYNPTLDKAGQAVLFLNLIP